MSEIIPISLDLIKNLEFKLILFYINIIVLNPRDVRKNTQKKISSFSIPTYSLSLYLPPVPAPDFPATEELHEPWISVDAWHPSPPLDRFGANRDLNTKQRKHTSPANDHDIYLLFQNNKFGKGANSTFWTKTEHAEKK